MADQIQDHYAILGVSRTATAADVKAAYNSLVLIHHPDKGGDSETFIKVQQAYEVLRSPESREAYNREQQRAEARKAQEKTKTKKAEDKQQTRKQPAAGRGEREEREPQRQRMPKEHRDRDEGHKQANARDAHKQQQQRRRRADSFFSDDSFFDDDPDDKFTFQVFDDFQGFAAGFQFPPDKNRNAHQARTRQRDQPPKSPKSPKKAPAKTYREKVHFERTEEGARNQRDRGCHKDCGEKSPPRGEDQKSPTKECGEKPPPKNRDEPHPQHHESTFEGLLSEATAHSEQFNYAYSKLLATIGSHSSKYSDVCCHLQLLKGLLLKRILSVKLAQRDHTVLELRQGLKEGALKPPKDIISNLSSKIKYDHGVLKDTGNFMVKAYESAKELREPTKKRQGFIDSESPACTVSLDSAMRVLQTHLTNLFKP